MHEKKMVKAYLETGNGEESVSCVLVRREPSTVVHCFRQKSSFFFKKKSDLGI